MNRIVDYIRFMCVYHVYILCFPCTARAGVYSIVMTVHDVAGNTARARTLVFSDPHNNIEVADSGVMSVSGGEVSDGAVWVDQSGDVPLSWSSVFSNPLHVSRHYMKEAEQLHDTIDDTLPDDGKCTRTTSGFNRLL